MKGIIKVELDGLELGFAFNNLTVEYVCDALNIAVTEWGDLFKEGELPSFEERKKRTHGKQELFYQALKVYEEMYNVSFKIPSKAYLYVLLSQNLEVLTQVMKAFTDSFDTSKELPKEGDSKKKSISVK